MTLACLRDDALSSTPEGFRLLLSLPWIRSLPLWSVSGLTITIDGVAVPELQCEVGGRVIDVADLAHEDGWWFLQEPLPLLGPGRLDAGSHEVVAQFSLTIPYLPAGPDAPLTLPFHVHRMLAVDEGHTPSATATAAAVPSPVDSATPLPTGWTLAASAFNWTPEVIRSERAAPDIAVDIVSLGVASVIELEPGQLWRSFPAVADAEAEQLRERLAAVGGSVSIVGASLDDWASPTRRRTDAERLEFLLPQLRTAERVGAQGVRLPIGQAGKGLLERILPVLHDLDLMLFEEAQGQQHPASTAHAAAFETIADFDDDHLRLLVDISMLMPALPVSYLDRLEAGGIPGELLTRLRDDWKDQATQDAVVALLRSGGVPPELHALYMDMIVRFGRSDAADLRAVLPLVGAFHLKFWDLDDADGRVSAPIRALGAELSATGFTGTLCSEWGGHEWIDADAADMTRRHLELASSALAAGAALASTR
ncbi:Xylose isomerase-like TIM barrel [Microbacterium hydrocarbonoxydans]|uniref:Xylose isomerase-like TIM barrel n=1 Tax=Microbacterium hydrocarbonoxydans TaxID=273678 RepID=A0A0M2HKS9_9MICO|nr:hypothetical protein [Microbacterium hydrocarbonoxydans]KJL47347.1 Xylose isomerase-like TIM barrel [Microbacterium hydrocarbonoxydans]